MNSREKYLGSKEEFYFFLKDEVIKLFKDKLKIEGTRVVIPDNEELDYQIKFDSDENYGDFTIKVKWGEKPEQLEDFEENTNDNEDNTFEF
ncbi:hypothetical protein LGL55_23200 [Clostridium tagluense]|uniref:Amphi-Trp domain-containing protein n=1 Tax=Clostridium tagluense TaxID=360422 RepID=A0A401UKD0_9CLOT|nr:MULTISPECIES: hypothetical protein [Clostridium]MBU3130379.1 hypothetical protein [Clostridium tagluense]MBW9157094.1 hypothetical protein [Clostridium tagluense]MBZ9623122.1 hypothetical protein [Clostridium sp. FP2]MCB2296622.1 hypothetical protein [Clostridium tagluense]MCB2313969.1 hypothetical protein [Clostridium tagluense]